jgi:hypothetical protein
MDIQEKLNEVNKLIQQHLGYSKFWCCGRGSFDSVFGVPIYGNKNSDAWWFKGIIQPLHMLGVKLHKCRLWISYRISPRHKFHLIDTKLPPGYYDQDYRMLHGMFALLEDYVEESGGIKHIQSLIRDLSNPENDPYAPQKLKDSLSDFNQTVVSLYLWWFAVTDCDLQFSVFFYDVAQFASLAPDCDWRRLRQIHATG